MSRTKLRPFSDFETWIGKGELVVKAPNSKESVYGSKTKSGECTLGYRTRVAHALMGVFSISAEGGVAFFSAFPIGGS